MDKTSKTFYPVMLCVRVPLSLWNALEKARHLERRTRSQMVRILLEDALEAQQKEKPDGRKSHN